MSTPGRGGVSRRAVAACRVGAAPAGGAVPP